MTTILLVEDDRGVLGLMGIVLKKMGHESLKACNAEEALALSKSKERFDMVITDVRLGGMDGFELGALLQIGRPELRILYISGYIADASSLLYEKKIPENDFFLHKPFLPRELSDMIDIMLCHDLNRRASP